MRNPYCVMGTVLTFLLCLFYIRMKTDPHANPSFSIDMGTMGTSEMRGNMTAMMPTNLSEIKENDMTAVADTTTAASQKPEDSFPGTWLVSVGVKIHTVAFRDMLHFLNVIGVGEEEDLTDLANSFEDIASYSNLGTEYTPMVLMKLKNALWRTTGLPDHVESPVSIADMIKMVNGTRKVDTPLKASQSTGNPTPHQT